MMIGFRHDLNTRGFETSTLLPPTYRVVDMKCVGDLGPLNFYEPAQSPRQAAMNTVYTYAPGQRHLTFLSSMPTSAAPCLSTESKLCEQAVCIAVAKDPRTLADCASEQQMMNW